jgi:hypothetical protein
LSCKYLEFLVAVTALAFDARTTGAEADGRAHIGRLQTHAEFAGDPYTTTITARQHNSTTESQHNKTQQNVQSRIF